MKVVFVDACIFVKEGERKSLLVTAKTKLSKVFYPFDVGELAVFCVVVEPIDAFEHIELFCVEIRISEIIFFDGELSSIKVRLAFVAGM